MRCLYLSLINFDLDDGYNRKTLGQLTAFTNFGWDSDIVCYRDNTVAEGRFRNGTVAWKSESQSMRSITIRRIYLFWRAFRSIVENSPGLVYIRYPRADIFFTLFLLHVRLRFPFIKLISEIPTYPFQYELPKMINLRSIIIRFGELLFRPIVNLMVSAYAVVAYDGDAFGKYSIRVENGVDDIDFDEIKCSVPTSLIEMVFVANFSANNLRHGLDRLLEGLMRFKDKNSSQTIRLNIVGDVTSQNQLFEAFKKCLGSGALVFHGRKNFEELKVLYRNMHLGIGCLGFHRIGVTHTSALKEREYFSFGLPIITSSSDFSFDEMFPYRLQLPADEGAVDINHVLSFVDSCYQREVPRFNIRKAALESAGWTKSMIRVKSFVERM